MVAVDADSVFEVLADRTRREIVKVLGHGPRRAGELSDTLAVSPPAMSRHLRVLLEVGVVRDERGTDDARTRIFRLEPDAMVAMRAWLDQLQAQWDEQLGSFKEHVERRGRRP